MPHVITQNCCNDAACVDACPVDCIHPRPDEPGFMTAEMLYIDPETCIDCGACIPMCPVDAIRAEADLDSAGAPYKDLNATYASISPEPTGRADRPLTIKTLKTSLRVAVVGAGPAGLFAAESLLTQPGMKIEVDVFDRLPTPLGLIRAGVAPDHQQTKAAAEFFRWTARRPGFQYHLGVEIGKDIMHSDLTESYHAVIYAVGAATDRHLNIAGEDLPGSHGASEFVAWYNGHPDFAQRSFDLSGPRAVIVGNGNVALDMARILLSDPKQLARTDIADHALDELRHSKVREVVVLGRRGAAEAAYTTPELMGLGKLSGTDIVIDPAELTDNGTTGTARLKADLAHQISNRPVNGHDRRIVLRYLLSPVEITGDVHVEGIRLVRNKLQRETDGTTHAHPTEHYEDLATNLVIRSIGYKGTSVDGLPFDNNRGLIPNEGGRIAHGVYATGWIKRGPSGVIGTNKKCARETVDALLNDAIGGHLTAPLRDRDHIDRLLNQRAPNRIGVHGWNLIDQHERNTGRQQGRPRVKLTSTTDMHRAAWRAHEHDDDDTQPDDYWETVLRQHSDRP